MCVCDPPMDLRVVFSSITIYSNTGGAALRQAAENVVPNGTTKPKKDVLSALHIDSELMTNHRVIWVHHTAHETWQLSKNFDITWMATRQDRTPLEDENRLIYGVRINRRGK